MILLHEHSPLAAIPDVTEHRVGWQERRLEHVTCVTSRSHSEIVSFTLALALDLEYN